MGNGKRWEGSEKDIVCMIGLTMNLKNKLIAHFDTVFADIDIVEEKAKYREICDFFSFELLL